MTIGTHSQIRTADRPRIRRVLYTAELSAYIIGDHDDRLLFADPVSYG